MDIKTQGAFCGCQHHGDDYEACIRYSGSAPCGVVEDAERFRYLVRSGAFRLASPDMGGNHTWTGQGRVIGQGPTIEDAIDKMIGNPE